MCAAAPATCMLHLSLASLCPDSSTPLLYGQEEVSVFPACVSPPNFISSLSRSPFCVKLHIALQHRHALCAYALTFLDDSLPFSTKGMHGMAGTFACTCFACLA